MKTGYVSLLMLVLVFAQLCCCPVILAGVSDLGSRGVQSTGPRFAAYDENEPIQVSGNDDFAAQAILNGWPGSGSSETPYVIANLNITLTSETEPLVNITDTTVYFRLENCLLVGGSIGVCLSNVSFGSLVDTTIEGCLEQGVLAMSSRELTIIGSEVADIGGQGVNFNQVNDSVIQNVAIEECSDRGVLVDYSRDCVVSSSRIALCSGGGAVFRDSDNCTLYNNTVTLTSGDAMTLGNAWYCDITENTIVNCTGVAMSIQSSPNATIYANVVCNSTGDAVRAENSGYCTIWNNTFYMNWFHAVRLSSDNGQVCGNNFVDNMLTYPAAGECANQGSNNRFSFNFWSKWLAPDDNADGYVDTAYEVGGGAYDEYPRTRVYLTDRIHLVTRPILLTPNGTTPDQRIWGEINVEWAPSSDTFGHTVTYSLHYSSDDGQSWSEVASELTQTGYVWNSSIVGDNEYCRLLVGARCSTGLESSDLPDFSLQVLEHRLTGLRVTYPNGGETITSGITVTWEPANDSYEHDITYAVYISPDGGSTWIELDNATTGNSMDLGGSSFNSGSDYLLRVVAKCSDGLQIEDVSDAPFTISSWVQSYGPWLVVVGAAAVIAVAVLFLKRR